MRNKAVIIITSIIGIAFLLYFEYRKKCLNALIRANEIAKTAKGVNKELEANILKILQAPDFIFKSLVKKWMAENGVSELRDSPLVLSLGSLSDPTYEVVSDFYIKALKLKIAGINN